MFFDTDRFEMITIYCVVYCIPDLRRLNGTLKTRPFHRSNRSASAHFAEIFITVFDFRLVAMRIYIYGIDSDARSIQQKENPCTTERNFSQWAQCIQSAGENCFPLSTHSPTDAAAANKNEK